MAVTFRSATDDARGTTTNSTPALPAGTVAGDLLIAVQASDTAGTLAAMTAPAGWTEVGSGSRTDAGFVKVWTKTATGSEPATYTFVDSTSAHGSAIVIAVTGHNTTTPLAVVPVFANGAAATSHPSPSVTGVVDGLLITAYLAGTAGTTRSYTTPTGMTNAQKSSLTTAANILLEADYLALTSAGATGAKAATCSASTPYVTMALVVAPASTDQTVAATGIATAEAFGSPTVTLPAKRFYLTNTAAGYTPATPRGAWDNTSQSVVRKLGEAQEGANTSVNVADTSTTNAWDVLAGRWVSQPMLAAGTISGVASWAMGVVESDTANNMFHHVHAYVTVGDSDLVRGTLVGNNISATEYGATAAGRGDSSVGVTPVACQAGDRLVVEVGYVANNTTLNDASGVNRNATLWYGGTGTDLAVNGTAVTTAPGWFEVSAAAPLFTAPTATPAPDLAWMTIGADTAPELATAKTNGCTHGLVEVFWDQCQTASGGAVTATGVLANIQRVIDAGMKPVLRVSLQYIPTFVDTAAVRFRRNGAVDHNPGNVSGNNARDWVWSASTRALVDDFLTKLFNQLDWSKIDRVQLGGGPAGELQYPDSDGTQWWGFSAPAQTGTDLAAGQAVCPSPGYVPSTGTTWTATDVAWASWYTQSLNNWMLWLIAKHRAYFTGPVWVMHPGAGLRKTSQTPTGGQALNYRVNVAKGVDWDTQIAAYPDANVWPYSTWADSPHFFTAGAYSDVNDGDAAPWYHLLRVARNRGRAARIWGENTGGQTNTDMDRVFSPAGAVGHGYRGLVWLSHDSLADGTGDTYANWAVRIATANKAVGSYRRGVNMAGGEFAPSAATLPGTYDVDYAYDTAQALTNVAARGHKIVRLPIRWERIQPTRGAALNTAELTRLQTVVANASAAGLRVVLDVHNYARYINSSANGGAELVLGASLPVSDLVDLWTRLSTAFQGVGGIYAYGLMNEPHDLVGSTGSFTGTTRYDWATGVQGWTGDAATAANSAGKLRLSAAVGAGNVLFRKDDAGAVAGGTTPTGSVIRFEATLVTNPGGTWTAKAQWQNSSFAYQNPTSVTYTRVSNGAAESGLVAGVAVYVTCTFASITSPPNAFALQFDGTGATAGTVVVDVDNFAQGTASGATTGAQVWEQASQQVVTAIRGRGDVTKILVPGYGFSGAQTWPTNHAAPWITGGGDIAYEAHFYVDVDNSGDYPDTFATETTAATSGGYASLASRATVELQRWTTWLAGNGVRGFLGEVGWPNTADTAAWNAVGDAIYTECDLHTVDVTYWSGGARWGASYKLSVYTGAAQDVIKSQATIVEAHPSLAVGADDQTVTATGIATAEAFGVPTVTAAALTVTAVGIPSSEAFGVPTVTVPASPTPGGLYPSDTLYPSDSLYPSDAGAVGNDQTVFAVGIPTAEAFGSPVVATADGPQTVVATAIDSAEAFGTPTVAVEAAPQTVTIDAGIPSAEAFGLPSITIAVPPPVVTTGGNDYVDTYFIDGIDLRNYAVRIETAEALQDAPAVLGDDIPLPGRDGAIEVFGGAGQQRRPDSPGKISFTLSLIGVDPDTGRVPTGSTSAQEYWDRWDELVRRIYRRRVTIDHPRPDGARRATAHLVPGDSIGPSRLPSSAWFGRLKVTFAIPGAHWLDLNPVTTGVQSLTSGGSVALSVFAAATAPCTELRVVFGSGNNPRLSTSYGYLGWNGVIAAGRQLGIDTAAGTTDQAGGSAWVPGYDGLTYSPGPRLLEVDPSEPLGATLTHTGGGTMTVEVSGKRRYRTS